jgi:hypothetical protein
MLDMRTYAGGSGGPVFLASPIQRRPGAPLAGTPYVTGLLASAAERFEWAFVIEAPAIRRAIALVDQTPPAAAPPATDGFTVLPPPPASAPAAANAKP